MLTRIPYFQAMQTLDPTFVLTFYKTLKKDLEPLRASQHHHEDFLSSAGAHFMTGVTGWVAWNIGGPQSQTFSPEIPVTLKYQW